MIRPYRVISLVVASINAKPLIYVKSIDSLVSAGMHTSVLGQLKILQLANILSCSTSSYPRRTMALVYPVCSLVGWDHKQNIIRIDLAVLDVY